MTPSRQQILSYSGIRLEERASAMQKEQQEARDRAGGGMGASTSSGRGRLHSSSDSMLLKGTTPLGVARQRICSSEPRKSLSSDDDGRESVSDDGDDEEDSSSSSSSGQSSEVEEGEGEEEEEEDEEYVLKKEVERKRVRSGHANSNNSDDVSVDNGSSGGGRKRRKTSNDRTPSLEVSERSKSRSSSGDVKPLRPTQRTTESPASKNTVRPANFSSGCLKSPLKAVKRKKPQQLSEEEEEDGEKTTFDPSCDTGESKKQSRNRKESKINPRKPTSKSARLRHRLRSMDTVSSEESDNTEVSSDEIDVSTTPSMNGVRGGENEGIPLVSVTPATDPPATRGRARGTPGQGAARNWPLHRQSRSKSSSSIYEAGRGDTGTSDPEDTQVRSSCFSDSDIKGYLSTPGGVPSASSSEDLTALGARLNKRGGSKWRRPRAGGKRKASASSSGGEENAGDRKRRRLNAELLGGRLLNGMVMNGEEGEIKPMDLVWAKCRGYPPYPALVSTCVSQFYPCW